MEDDLGSEYDKPFYAFYKRPLWAFKRAPPFVNADIRDDTQDRSLGILSIPTYCYMLDLSMDQIDYGTIYIKYKTNISKSEASTIYRDLKNAIPNDWGVYATKE